MFILAIAMVTYGNPVLDDNKHVDNLNEPTRECEILRLMDVYILSGGRAKDSDFRNIKHNLTYSDSQYIDENFRLFYIIIGSLSGIPTGYRWPMGLVIENDEHLKLNDWYKKHHLLIKCEDVQKLVNLYNIITIDSISLRMGPLENITIDEYIDLYTKQFEDVTNKMDSIGGFFRKKHNIEDPIITEEPTWTHYY